MHDERTADGGGVGGVHQSPAYSSRHYNTRRSTLEQVAHSIIAALARNQSLLRPGFRGWCDQSIYSALAGRILCARSHLLPIPSNQHHHHRVYVNCRPISDCVVCRCVECWTRKHSQTPRHIRQKTIAGAWCEWKARISDIIARTPWHGYDARRVC